MRLSARTIAERRASTGASGSGILTDIDLLQTPCVITAKHACAHAKRRFAALTAVAALAKQSDHSTHRRPSGAPGRTHGKGERDETSCSGGNRTGGFDGRGFGAGCRG